MKWWAAFATLFGVALLVETTWFRHGKSVTFDETIYLSGALQTLHDGRLDPRLAAAGVAPLPILLEYLFPLSFAEREQRPSLAEGKLQDARLIDGPRLSNSILVGLPLLREATGSFGVAVADAFYRSGSLVFGGGHVVLPLLQAEVVPPGWLDDQTFIAGYGAAQAVPGPLFTFAAYLGAAMRPGVAGVATGLLALAAVFLPSFLLLIGVLPFWDRLRAQASVQAALRGVNAAVVGLLLAALYEPVWTSAVRGAPDLALGLAAFLLLAVWRWPAWAVVLLSAVVGAFALG